MADLFQIFVKNRFEYVAAAYLGIVPAFSMENTHIPGYDDLYHLFDYNRLRGELTLECEEHPEILATLILDNENLYSENSGSLSNKTLVYRALLEYKGAKHFWVLGKQRIPLGVGRFWNPVDVFNPIDIQAIEPNERPGTNSIHYEYALSQLSGFNATIARKKGAVRLKGYLDFADLALVGEWDEEQNLDIIGWEVEGELAGTGIELRSEGGSFHDRKTGQRSTEFIFGADYGFANSLVLTGEYHYIDELRRDELGLSVSFQPTMLWSCFLTSVTDLNDGSGFVAPAVEYSLSDEMILSGGAFIYHGPDSSLYGNNSGRLYIRWFIHF